MVQPKTITNDLTSKLGQNIDADGVYGSQCVDTINYVLKKYFNITLWGNAIDLPQSAKAKGLTWIDNEVGNVNSKPQEGDFFVMDTTNLYGHPYGHTGYVVSSDGYTMVTYETNVDGNADALSVGGPLRKLNRDFAGVIGWFRPKYEGTTTNKATVTNSVKGLPTKNVNGDLFSGTITDVDPNIMNSDSNRVTIDRVLIHHNGGTSDEGARRTWYVSTGIGTSAHYQVTPNKIWGCVGENFVAYHAGNYGMNQRSIGIEHLNNTGAPSWTIAEATYLNSAKLIADICTRYNIPVDRKHILKHGEVSSTACLPESYTELLTPSGWVTLKDIKVGDTVATFRVDDNSIIFDKVYAKVPSHKKDTWLFRDVEVTSDHRMLHYSSKMGDPYITSAKDMLSGNRQRNLLNAGKFTGKGLDMSNSLLEFLVAVQADGHYMLDYKNQKRPYGIEFHLKKERKVNRILDIIDELGYEYSHTLNSDMTHRIRLYGKDKVDFVEGYLKDKNFTWEFLQMSQEQFEVFMSALLDFDGCRAGNDYSSSEKVNIDIVQALCSLHNVGTRQSNNSQRVHFTPNYRSVRSLGGISSSAKRKSNVDVSCVSVTSGLILIRQHGRTTIVGNCPGGIDIDRLVRMAKDIVNNSSSQTIATNSGVPNLGGEGMSFTFQIKGDKGWNAGTIYYYNAYTNEIRGFHNPEELKWTQIVFKETTGRELKHYVWNTSAPVYTRVFSALQPKRY